MQRVLAIALVGLVACRVSGKDDGLVLTPPIVDTETDRPTDTDTDTDTEPFVATGEGSLVLLQRHAYVGDVETVELRGLFADSLQGRLNAAECFPLQGPRCIDVLPTTPDSAIDITDEVFDGTTAQWIDVGPTVALGPQVAAAIVDAPTNTPWYRGTFVPFDAHTPHGVTIEGGDWGDYTGRRDIVTPDLIRLYAPNPLATVPAVQGATLGLTWQPGTRGQVYLVANSATAQTLWLLEDDGLFMVDVDALGADATNPDIELQLGRWVTSTVDVNGASLTVVAKSEQPLHATWRPAGTRVNVSSTNDCSVVPQRVPLTTGLYAGSLAGRASALDPNGGCLALGAPGAEALHRVLLQPGEALTAALSPSDFDGALYLLTDCTDAGTCLAGTDRVAATADELLRYIHLGPGVLDATLVVDSWGGGTAWDLDITIDTPTVQAFPDTCAIAASATPIAPGLHTTSLLAATATMNGATTPNCAPSAAAGREVFLPISVGAEQRLTASANAEHLVLYVVSDCGDVRTCGAGAGGPADPFGTVTYDNRTTAPQTVYLVLDEGAVGDIGVAFELTVSLDPIPTAVLPDTCTVAQSTIGFPAGTLTADLTDYTGTVAPTAGTCTTVSPDGPEAIVTVDLGNEEVLVATVDDPDAVVYIAGDCTDFSTCGDRVSDQAAVFINDQALDQQVYAIVDTTSGSGADLVDLTLTVSPRAPLFLGHSPIEAASTCAEASVAPATPDGAWYSLWSGAASRLDPGVDSCVPRGADTREQLYPVEVPPGDELQVTYQALADQGVVYLVSDCNDAATCVAGEDAGFDGIAELSWVNTTDSLFRGYVVLDSRGPLTSGDLYRFELTVTPVPSDLADTCAQAQIDPALGSGLYFATPAVMTDDLAPSAGVCTTAATDGGDGFAKVTLQDGELLTATVGDDDAYVYVMSDCTSTVSCLSQPHADTALWLNETGAPEDVYIAVDSTASAPVTVSSLTLDIAGRPELAGRTALPPARGCAAAQAASPLASGSYWGSLLGAPTALDPGTTGCTATSTPGAEGLYKVVLQPGEQLAATADVLAGDGALYLLGDCSNAASCVTGSDHGSGAETVVQVNIRTIAETWYLVVDGEPGAFVLDVDIVPAPTSPVADTCGAAASSAVSSGGSLLVDLSALNADLSPTAGQCTASSPDGADALVRVQVGPGGTLTATVGNPDALVYVMEDCNDAQTCTVGGTSVVWTNPGATREVYVVVDSRTSAPVSLTTLDITVDNPLTLADTCPQAQALSPVEPLTYQADTTGFQSVLDPPCVEDPLDGPDGLVPVRIGAGEMIVVDATAPIETAYLVTDCNVPSSCFTAGNPDTGLGYNKGVMWHNSGPATDAFLGFDAPPGVSGAFQAHIDIAPALPIWPADTCGDLGGVSPLVTGRTHWTGDMGTYVHDYDPATGNNCTGIEAYAADGIIPVRLQPGETLDAQVKASAPNGDAALYLLQTCGDMSTCVAGEDDWNSSTTSEPVPDRVIWTNNAAAMIELYLVVDGFNELHGYWLVVDIG